MVAPGGLARCTHRGAADVVHKVHADFEGPRTAQGLHGRSAAGKNDFALGTWAPLSLCGAEKRSYHLDIFVDKCSVELFVDGGRIAMTNLVFPTAPYNNIKVYAEGGKSEVKNMKVYKLGL